MKIAFAGTPEFAVSALDAIAASSHRLVRVYTQPDRPAGRGRKLAPSAVAIRAETLGLAVDKSPRFDASAIQALHDSGADILVVVAYGLILPVAALHTPALGAINIHASLLPRWRGAAPIQRAIEAGDRQTGVTIMQMDAGLDTGPMLLHQAVDILDSTSGGELHDSLAQLGSKLVVEALDQLAAGTLDARPQPQAGVCYAHKLSKQEARIDWAAPAAVVHRRIRAMNPVPVCWTLHGEQRLRIFAAELSGEPAETAPGSLRIRQGQAYVACQDQWLQLTQLQRPGGRPVAGADWARTLNDEPQRFD